MHVLFGKDEVFNKLQGMRCKLRVFLHIKYYAIFKITKSTPNGINVI